MRVVHPARRLSLPQEITRQLLELIADGRFPGDRLPPERDLGTRLGVSRGPLREALSTLQHLGVVEVRGRVRIGRRTRARTELALLSVAQPERALVKDPLEARRMLEPEIAATAAARADEDALATIAEWITRMEELSGPDDADRALECDSAFHLAIARATGNPVLVSLIEALAAGSFASRAASWKVESGQESSVRGHRDILAALRSRDPDRARLAMKVHLDDVEGHIRRVLGTGGPA
ncbi:MAG: hypothetical protein QOD44_1724 [Solirubrobacteraceae bacterium]|nr:hypothetical protein [Solirubrobacteraceae bacterium]MEA2317535.1 hypothetical protein [Solirubrobacteraceae bacterium]